MLTTLLTVAVAVLSAVASLVAGTWAAAGVVLFVGHRLGWPDGRVGGTSVEAWHAAAQWLWAELRPIYPVAAGTNVVALVATVSWWSGGSEGLLWVLCWVLLRKIGGDDDRWRRRRAKLAARVAATAAGLRVVPVALAVSPRPPV